LNIRDQVTYREEVNRVEGIVVPAHEYARRIYSGPCLACGREMEYDIGTFRFGGEEEWLEKQFARRDKLLKSLQKYYPESKTRSPGLGAIESIVCKACREEYEQLREADARRWQAAHEAEKERNKRERERFHYHNTWRDAKPGEFDRSKQSADFRAVLFNQRFYEITFRWRATDGDCRGDSPRNIVGMWVEGKLTAHYAAWNLKPYESDHEETHDYDGYVPDSYDQDPRYDYGALTRRWDVFGQGFCKWIEREFQSELLQIEPAFIWRARNADSLDTCELPSLSVIHTVWIDGSVYAQIKYDWDLKEVAAWALRHLGMRIEEREFRPVVVSIPT